MAIKKLLDEISVIPGVTGSCIFDNNEGPLCTDSDANIASDVLLKVGSFLIRMLKMGTMNNLDIRGCHYRFNNCTVVSTPLSPGAVLLTICNTKANCSLVATTAEMLAADMRKHLSQDAFEIPDLPDLNDLEDLDLGALDDEDIEEIEVEELEPSISSNVQYRLDKIEEALAEAVGPVAGMILRDCVDKWVSQGAPTLERLGRLVTMVAGEISDDSLVGEFKQKTARLIS